MDIRLITVLAVLLASFFSHGCASRTTGSFTMKAAAVDPSEVEVRGLVWLPTFRSWKNSGYGDPPRQLIEELVMAELRRRGIPGASIVECSTNYYENSNYIGFMCRVRLERTAQVVPQKWEGSFPASIR